MKFVLGRDGGDIVCLKDWGDCESRGEIAQILVELEYLKQELLMKYAEVDDG